MSEPFLGEVKLFAGTFAPEQCEPSSGNVLAPGGAHRIDGGWRGSRRRDLRRALVDAVRAALRGRSGASAS